MDRTSVLKALADETRLNVLTLLLEHNFCVRALAKHLNLTEGAVSQHLKVLRHAGLVVGIRKGHFMHYHVRREVLHDLAQELEALAAIETKTCTPVFGDCKEHDNSGTLCCHSQK